LNLLFEWTSIKLAPILPANIRLRCNRLAVTNAQAYYIMLLVTAIRGLIAEPKAQVNWYYLRLSTGDLGNDKNVSVINDMVL
jgi:hypothetical protein